ncbi:tetratricopeptide repeat protein [Shewanella kaireitica]|uniref:tetratricopeptide repeat protein n=1 Tax=Shewanella kaireitica TaxID=212021 RepID=UPI00200CC302|nr:tetratricopeptide repeat protein [Shewanella kaireitica]MCL1094163.1 tetratricopeptide repeat protein [Shewanella kaireitica]
MSVINKMLKDLDKRQQPHGIESMAKPQSAVMPQRQSKRPLVFACSLSLLLGGLVVYLVMEPALIGTATNHLAAQKNNAEQLPVTPKQNVGPSQKESIDSASMANASAAAPADVVGTLAVKEPKNEAVKEAKSKLASTDIELASVAPEVVDTPTEEPIETVSPRASLGAKKAPVQIDEKQTATKSVSSMSIAPAKRGNQDRYSGSNMAVKEVKLTPQQLAQKQMILANDAQQQGLHSDALTYYKAALSYNPALHQARRQAAALYYGQNKLSEAALLLKQGQLLFPQEYEYALLLARVQQSAGQNKQALSSLAQIPDTSPLAVKKWHQQSDLAQKEQNFPVAEQSFRQLAKNEPSQGRWWMGLGYALDAQKNYTEAKNAYNQALAQGNLSSQAQAYVDNRLVQLGAY